jgi:hypothetical protein
VVPNKMNKNPIILKTASKVSKLYESKLDPSHPRYDVSDLNQNLVLFEKNVLSALREFYPIVFQRPRPAKS